MFSRLTNVGAHVRISSLSSLNNNFAVCIYHIFLNPFITERSNLGCFHLLAIVFNAAVSLGVYYLFKPPLKSFGYICKVDLLIHMLVLFFYFLRNCHTVFCFPQQVHHYTPTSRAQDFSTSSPALVRSATLVVAFLMDVKWNGIFKRAKRSLEQKHNTRLEPETDP